MQHSYTRLCLLIFTAALVTACNDSNDNDSSSNGPLQQFAGHTGDSKEIMAPAALAQDISRLFGTVDSEPVAVSNNDTVSSLTQR